MGKILKPTKNEIIIDSLASESLVKSEELIKAHNINTDEWTITKALVNKWDVLKKDDKTGVVAPVPMHQTKLTLEKNISKAYYDQIRKEFLEEVKKFSPVVKKKPSIVASNEGHLLEINLFDFHFGKMSWHEETGANFDTKIAKELFSTAISEIINKSKGYKIDKILFPIGNDFFNSDYAHPFNKTTNGTPQEEDLRWQRTFREGRELLVESINKLTEIAPVDVIVIPGNHDFEKSFYLGDSLEGWFHNNPNVNINNLASPRKYYQYHNVLLGFTHGNNEKVTTLPIIMAQECSEMWASSKFREFHLGHIHHKKEIKYQSVGENAGVIIRYMSSLTATDSWHHKKGYIGSNRTAEAYIYGKENGLQAQLFFNL